MKSLLTPLNSPNCHFVNNEDGDASNLAFKFAMPAAPPDDQPAGTPNVRIFLIQIEMLVRPHSLLTVNKFS